MPLRRLDFSASSPRAPSSSQPPSPSYPSPPAWMPSSLPSPLPSSSPSCPCPEASWLSGPSPARSLTNSTTKCLRKWTSCLNSRSTWASWHSCASWTAFVAAPRRCAPAGPSLVSSYPWPSQSSACPRRAESAHFGRYVPARSSSRRSQHDNTIRALDGSSCPCTPSGSA